MLSHPHLLSTQAYSSSRYLLIINPTDADCAMTAIFAAYMYPSLTAQPPLQTRTTFYKTG